MNVAQLTIEMAANVARLKTDMAAARNTVEGTMNSIKKAAGVAGAALGAIGVGLSAGAFASWIKGAINAADEANKLSQKIGIAVKEIGGLQLAFQQGGVDADSMQTALAKLNKNIAAGDTAFKALGVSTKNADGSLRSTTSVLADIADRFAGTENNANKTAMAIEIFGKSGAALIPVLNAGGDSIREFQELAQQLGLTLSEETALAAEKFNDTLELISMGSRGIANQVMAELLPTLQSLAGEFLNLMTQGGNLKGVADVISAGLKGLFSAAVIGVEIFRTLGNTIGATAAGIVAFASGDFKGAVAILGELGKDIRTNWTTSLESLDRLWNQSGNTAIEAAAKITKGSMQSSKAMEESAKAAKKLADEQEKARKAADDLLLSIQFETKTQQMSNIEKEIAINLRKLEQTGLQQNTAEYRAYAEAIRQSTIENEGIKERIKLEKEAAEKRKKIEEDYAKEIEQINFQIGQSLTDALINGGQTAKEFLINMFKTLILRPILQPIITGGTAAVTSMLGMNGTANAGTSLSSVSQLGSLASMASSVNNAYTALTTATLGALDSIAAGAQAATFAVGEGLASMGFESAGAAVFNSAGTVGLAAQGAAGIGAGTLAGEWISGGKSLIGGNSLYTTGGGAAAGAALGTAIVPGIGTFVGGLIGGIVGGIANAAFGSGAKESAGNILTGTWTPSGVEGAAQYSLWTKKGGWFGGGGSGRDYAGMNADLEKYLDNSIIAVANATKGYADILGVNADAISGVTHYFEISANNVDELTANLQREFEGYANQLADVILAGTNFQQSGETSSQTLTRLASSLSTVNSTFGTLGIRLHEASLSGANVASAFIDMMGGIEGFNEATNFYYQNFYTQQERTQKATENLGKVFEAMNLTLPKNTQAFRALVDATAAAGTDVLLANLLKLAPAFMQISEAAAKSVEMIQQEQKSLMTQLYQAQGNTAALRQQQLATLDESNRAIQMQIWAIEDQKTAMQSASQAVSDAFSALQKAVAVEQEAALKKLSDAYDALVKNLNRQMDAANAAKQVAQENYNAFKGIYDMLDDAIQRIIGGVAGTAGGGMAFIDRAIANANRTGYLPSQEELSGAISDVTGSLGAENFATRFEMIRANADFANKLGQLQDVAFDQMTTAEMHLEAANTQIELLTQQLEQAKVQYDAEVEATRVYYEKVLSSAQAQIDALNGVNTSVMSVTEAISALGSAISGMASAMAGGGGGGAGGATGSTGQGGYKLVGNTLVFPGGQGTHQVAGANAAQTLINAYGLVPTGGGTYMRTRASGGYTPPGMTLVGEEGPELVNFSNPAMVYNTAQTSNLLSSGVSEEIRGLREDNKVQARAMVQLQTRMNRLFERWDGDGMPETRVVTA